MNVYFELTNEATKIDNETIHTLTQAKQHICEEIDVYFLLKHRCCVVVVVVVVVMSLRDICVRSHCIRPIFL